MNYWSLAGLILDLLGVSLLGIDLVRLHRQLRRKAADSREAYRELDDLLGGSAPELERLSTEASTRYSVPRHSGDTEEVYNAQVMKQVVTEVAGLASVIAGYVEGVARELSASARREERLSSDSLVFSYVGGGLVILGFGLQIVGLFH